jgi:hypothetical protein
LAPQPFGRRFRLYSIATIVVVLAAGVMTSLGAPRLQANLPTPSLGVWERANIGAWLLWVAVLSLTASRRSVRHERSELVGGVAPQPLEPSAYR